MGDTLSVPEEIAMKQTEWYQSRDKIYDSHSAQKHGIESKESMEWRQEK